MEVRLLNQAVKRLKLSPFRPAHTIQSISDNRVYSTKKRPEPKQAIPLGGFYEALLEYPLPTYKDVVSEPTPPPTLPSSMPLSQKEEIAARAASVFGTKDAAKFRRRSDIERNSVNIFGIKVPPRPTEPEPDDCCMSGCVNCVWETYRDELEEYAFAKRKADLAQRRHEDSSKNVLITAAVSMDDDGGGSVGNWTLPLEDEEDLFKGVPVGLREFMKQEKRLKEKRRAMGLDDFST